MQTHQRKFFQRHNVVRFVGRVSLVVVFGLLFLGVTLGVNTKGVHAQSLDSGEKYSTTRVTFIAKTSAFAPLKSTAPPVGKKNVFPRGACTWWANERYHQLHGVYVPWTTNANAAQWTERARDFHWHVSKTPKRGDILDLQPGVQGASKLGHVATVERILKNGQVIASSMSWGAHPKEVTYFRFTPGRGVTFIRR